MGIVILQKGQNITLNDLTKAREEYDEYIKVTVDLKKEIVAIGGEYHADAEHILIKEYESKSDDIVGGGYHLTRREYLTNAMLNIRPNKGNNSMEILDQKKREKFLKIVQELFKNINNLT